MDAEESHQAKPIEKPVLHIRSDQVGLRRNHQGKDYQKEQYPPALEGETGEAVSRQRTGGHLHQGSRSG